MKLRTSAIATVLGLGLATGFAAMPASAATPAPAHTMTAKHAASIAAYTGSAQDTAATKAFFKAVMKSAMEKRAAHPNSTAAVTVTYDASAAPTFKDQIAQSTQIWNGAVSNVKLAEGSGGDFQYREGDDPRGSYASTDGHGGGYVFLDYAQNQEYDSVRVTAHETGHVLGLPDHYEGPCTELMSGGGPGPSCTNSQPDANERGQVDQLWANGLSAFGLDQAAFAK